MKITKAVLTGGGRATRLRPITLTINKHLIPLANKPMIFHAIEKVADVGIKDIYINVNPGETELQKVVGDGRRWGVNITFFEQEGGPEGVAHVVKQAEKFIGDEPFIFYLSDNIILGSLEEFVTTFEKGGYDCMLALSEVPDPQRFGVPLFDESGVLKDVIEKPVAPPNNFAVTGIYLYGPKVFFEAFQHIEKSARGEYEISSIHSYLLKTGRRVGHREITGWWKDTGKPGDLVLANSLLLAEQPESVFTIEGKVHNGAKLKGRVRIEKGAQVGKKVKLIGPVIIGENSFLENCTVGPNVTVGPGTRIEGGRVSNTIILSNCNIECRLNITNSIFGDQAKILKNGVKDTHRFILGDHTLVEM